MSSAFLLKYYEQLFRDREGEKAHLLFRCCSSESGIITYYIGIQIRRGQNVPMNCSNSVN